MGRWGDGVMGRWGDGAMGRWGGGAMGRWGDGVMGLRLAACVCGTVIDACRRLALPSASSACGRVGGDGRPVCVHMHRCVSVHTSMRGFVCSPDVQTPQDFGQNHRTKSAAI